MVRKCDVVFGFAVQLHDVCSVSRTEYVLLSVSDDGFATLMDENSGEIRADLCIPPAQNDEGATVDVAK
jgi:hypothetical protein